MAQAEKEKAQLARVSAGEGGDAKDTSTNTAGMASVMKAMQLHIADATKKASAREAHAKKLAAVTIAKEDVELLAGEFDNIPRPALERHLRECGGDAGKALRQLVGLEGLTRGPQ